MPYRGRWLKILLPIISLSLILMGYMGPVFLQPPTSLQQNDYLEGFWLENGALTISFTDGHYQSVQKVTVSFFDAKLFAPSIYTLEINSPQKDVIQLPVPKLPEKISHAAIIIDTGEEVEYLTTATFRTFLPSLFLILGYAMVAISALLLLSRVGQTSSLFEARTAERISILLQAIAFGFIIPFTISITLARILDISTFLTNPRIMFEGHEVYFRSGILVGVVSGVAGTFLMNLYLTAVRWINKMNRGFRKVF